MNRQRFLLCYAPLREQMSWFFFLVYMLPQPPSTLLITMVLLDVKTWWWPSPLCISFSACFTNYFIHVLSDRTMARRRQEIALQTEIETQEEWNEAVNKEGVTGNESCWPSRWAFFAFRSFNFRQTKISPILYLSQWSTSINNGQAHVKVLKAILNASNLKLENNCWNSLL